MPSIYGVCDIAVPNPICDPCLSDAELGGVRGVAFIHKDAITAIKANPSSNVQWALLKDQGLIFIIPQTRGTFNGGDVVTRTGFGNKATTNVGFDFSLEYDDPSYKTNCAFYNQIMQSGMYHVAFMSQTQLKVSDSPVSVVPTAPLTDNTADQAVWHIIVTWQDKLQPCPADAPNDVFVCDGDGELPETQNVSILGVYGYQTTDGVNWIDQSVVLGGAYYKIRGGAQNIINGGEIFSKGGEIAFLISDAYDSPLTEIKIGALKIFQVFSYDDALPTKERKLDALNNYSTDGSINSVFVDQKVCESAVNADDSLNEYYTTYLLPNKYYYFAVYAKGNGMKGAFSTGLELKIPDIKPADSETPCSQAHWVATAQGQEGIPIV